MRTATKMKATGLEHVSREDFEEELQRRINSGDIDATEWCGCDADDRHGEATEEGTVQDEGALEEAGVRWRRKEYRETLFQLEKALGREFSGLADIKPENLQ